MIEFYRKKTNIQWTESVQARVTPMSATENSDEYEMKLNPAFIKFCEL